MEGGGNLQRILVGSMQALLQWKNRPTPPSGGVRMASLVEYRVTVHTGKMLCAGTDAQLVLVCLANVGK